MTRLLALLVFITTLGAANATLAQGEPRIVTTGEAGISVAPDMARITIGVEEFADTATDAINAMSDNTSDILDRLRDAGIAPKDMQTSGLHLAIERDYSNSTGRNRITGYRAHTQINVAVYQLDLLGDILAHTVSAGANQINNLAFDVADRAPHQEAARRAAVADARARALVYADAAGVTLGGLLHLSETGAPQPGPFAMEARMQMDAGSVPIAAGEIMISASVTLTYAIAD